MAIKTQKDLCGWYNVSTRTITNWLKAGAPLHERGGKGKPNKFDTTAIHNWLQEKEIARRVVTSDGQNYDKQDEEARLKHHQANMEELKEQEKRGELIPLDVVIGDFGEKVSNARAKILVLDQTIPKKYRPKLNAAIRSVLDELSQPEIEVQECA